MRARALLSVVVGMTAVALLVVPSAASAVTRYAEPGAGGANPACPQSDPCDLEEAVESAAVGDEVIVLTGTYTMSDPLSVNGSGTVVHGEVGQPRPVLQTSGFTGVGIGNTNAILRDFVIAHTGLGSGMTLIGTAERVSVRSTDPTADAGCSISFLARLRDSTCSTTAAGAAAIRSVMSGAFTHTLRVRNVTAVGSAGPGLFVRAEVGEDLTVDVKSSVIRGTAPGDVRAETDGAGSTSATVTLANSNFGVTSGGPASSITSPAAANNQSATPLFASASTGDFHQVGGSPTINNGVLDAESGTTDIDGQPRTQGLGPDIGADEFDEIAPVTSITSGPTEGETLTSPNVSFEFTADEPTTFACDIGGGFGACTGASSHTITNLANGAYTFTVRARDANGNLGTASRSFIVDVPLAPPVDVLAPQTDITKAPKNRTSKTKAKFKFTSSETGSTFECRIEKGDFVPCTSPQKYKRLDVGKHKFKVRAIDAAGNVDLTPAGDRWRVVEKD